MAAITNPKAIEAFGLRVAKRAVLLEAQGFRHSGRNVTPAWKKRFGVKTLPALLEAFDKAIAEAEEAI